MLVEQPTLAVMVAVATIACGKPSPSPKLAASACVQPEQSVLPEAKRSRSIDPMEAVLDFVVDVGEFGSPSLTTTQQRLFDAYRDNISRHQPVSSWTEIYYSLTFRQLPSLHPDQRWIAGYLTDTEGDKVFVVHYAIEGAFLWHLQGSAYEPRLPERQTCSRQVSTCAIPEAFAPIEVLPKATESCRDHGKAVADTILGADTQATFLDAISTLIGLSHDSVDDIRFIAAIESADYRWFAGKRKITETVIRRGSRSASAHGFLLLGSSLLSFRFDLRDGAYRLDTEYLAVRELAR